MQQQPQQQKSLEQQQRENFGILYALASAHTSILWTFLHKRMGVDFYGLINMSIGVLMICVMAAFGDPGFTVFLFIWLLMVLVQRQVTYQARKQGIRIHSKFWGYPLLQGVFRSYWFALVIAEPALCLFGGYALAQVSPAFGYFLMFGAFSGPFIVFCDWLKERRIDIAIDDARIEMERVPEDTRNEWASNEERGAAWHRKNNNRYSSSWWQKWRRARRKSPNSLRGTWNRCRPSWGKWMPCAGTR